MLDPAIWRVDVYCRPMRFDDFENSSSLYGWTIDEGGLSHHEASGVSEPQPIAFASLCPGGEPQR